MNAQSHRLPRGGCIDRNRPLSFRFDGKTYQGFAGDTLASALLAYGHHLLGRSFKYHRPRGCLSAGSEEPNALVELRDGAWREPNTRATMIELYDGLEANSQNRFPSLEFDILSFNQFLSPFLGAGFYYKTFMWPSSFWESFYEKIIRQIAGLGRAAVRSDPDRYEHVHLHCDILVVGGGPAGLAAVLAAGRSGARVVLAEELPWLGGSLMQEDDVIDALPARKWLLRTREQLSNLPNVQVKTRCAVFGHFDHKVLAAVERVGDYFKYTPEHMPRQRLWTIRAQEIILATGANERPLVFDNNDRPGIMLSSAVRCYVDRFAVVPGRRIAIATNNDDAYRTAFSLLEAGIKVPVIADARFERSVAARQAIQRGLYVQHGMLPMRTHGVQRVKSISLQRVDGGFAEKISCDCVAVSGGFSPNIALSSQNGALPQWRESFLGFVPGEDESHVADSVGACRGIFNLSTCLQEGHEAGLRAAMKCGRDIEERVSAPRAPSHPVSTITPLWHCPGKGKAFVDFQNDVTAEDIHLANREGYRSIEHVKRYTTLGMATDQGRTSNINGVGVLAITSGEPVEAVGITRYRPPAVPVAIGAFAGQVRGKTFQPVRRTAFHECHEKLGAVFVESGQWMRPRCYPGKEESMSSAIWREADLTRKSVGICDISTLGKIELFGTDTVEFLNRLYTNDWSTLAVGKARYGLMLREDGIVLDDGTTSRLGEDHFFMTTTTANAAAVLVHLEKYAQTIWPELDVHFCSATEQWCSIAVTGPCSRVVLGRTFGSALDFSDAVLPFMGVQEFCWRGATVRIFRISFSGELAYEVNVPWGYGEEMWERIIAAGKAHNILPYGIEAMGVMRIEKGHVAGNELDGRTTAKDLYLGGMISGRKSFIGEVLSRRAGMNDESRPSLVGIKPLNRKQRLRSGAHFVEDITRPGNVESLGWISSVADSPAVGCWIGLGFLHGGRKRLGQKLTAWYPLKEEIVEVEICEPVFVDPQGERLHG